MPRFAGKITDEKGDPTSGAQVNLYPRNTDSVAAADTTSGGDGSWVIDHSTQGRYDIEITNGAQVVRLFHDDEIQIEGVEAGKLSIRGTDDAFPIFIQHTATAERTVTIPDRSDGIVLEGGAQTITDKTLISPTIEGTIGAGSGLTLPAFTLGGKLTAGSSEIEGSNFDVNGGNIDNTVIGAATPVDATFDDLTAIRSFSVAQGGTANQAISIKAASGLDHDLTSQAPTDAFGVIKQLNANFGGLQFTAVAENSQVPKVLQFSAFGGTPSKSKSSSAQALVNFEVARHDGNDNLVNVQGGTNDDILYSWRGRISGSMRTLAILDADGDFYTDGTMTATMWDDYPDWQLARGLRASIAPAGSELATRFAEWAREYRPVLEEAGIVHYNDGPGEDGRPFVSHKRMLMLAMDGLYQLGQRLENMQDELKALRGA